MPPNREIQYVRQAGRWHSWAVLLLVATGCDRTPLGTPATTGGALSAGAAAGQGVVGVSGGTNVTGSMGGSGGAAGTTGLRGFGGIGGSGGLTTGSGGVTRTGGVAGVGSGGMVPAGGMLGSGGTGGAAGTRASSLAFGISCKTNDDCPSDSTCCNGSSESCDGTRLPTGDGTNPGELVVSADGLTVNDTITGLVWQRDGSGTRAGCTTDPSNLTCTWAEAKAYCASLTLAGVSGWRLPALMELETIVDPAMADPAIDATAFPDPTEDFYWTSSSVGFISNLKEIVVAVEFSSGSASWVMVESVTVRGTVKALERVRCVVGSRCYPTSRFVASSSDLVTDTLTKLVWQQQASTKPMIWQDASTYCAASGTGFRLPTLKELESIVDLTVISEPTINQASFPNTPGQGFWTSSPYVPPVSPPDAEAWTVLFSGGTPQRYSETYGSVWARCVR